MLCPQNRAAFFRGHGSGMDAILRRGVLDSEHKPVPGACARPFPTPTSSTAPCELVLCHSCQAWCPRRGEWPTCPPSGSPGGCHARRLTRRSHRCMSCCYLPGERTSLRRLSGGSRLPAGLCCLSVCPKAVSVLRDGARGQAVLSGGMEVLGEVLLGCCPAPTLLCWGTRVQCTHEPGPRARGLPRGEPAR